MMKNTTKSIFNSEAFDKWYDRFIIGGMAAMGIAFSVVAFTHEVKSNSTSTSVLENSVSAPTLK